MMLSDARGYLFKQDEVRELDGGQHGDRRHDLG